ncbi:MAG: RNA polymerase sigma factor [Pyrinomonadaceae bacterium]
MIRADAENQVRESLNHLFRYHAGQMVAVLSRIFGVANIDLIDDSVQDALVVALKTWPYGETPENPRAWLIQVAKNRVLDRLRHDKRSDSIDFDSTELELVAKPSSETRLAGEMGEDELRMIFACCHPSIPADGRVALTLKIVGGFSVAEIASAYLSSDDAAAKMLTRAKAKFRDGGISLEIPAQAELSERLDSVLRVLYLMFNEGYAASSGEGLIRRDLCSEAIRLAHIIAGHPVTCGPKVHALTALFLFQAARLSARSNHHGDLLLLSEQDRSRWDSQMLTTALRHFRLSAGGTELSDYHLEAEIASHYALAQDFESTNWDRILSCYDILQARRFSPVVELNRIIALGKVNGPAQALDELSQLGGNYLMTSFNLFHITRGHILSETGDASEAIAAYQRAVELTKNKAVLRFLNKRIGQLSL